MKKGRRERERGGDKDSRTPQKKERGREKKKRGGRKKARGKGRSRRDRYGAEQSGEGKVAKESKRNE